MYSYLVDDNNEHKKGKGVNKNVVGKITHNVYKDLLLNKRHSMNRIQNKYHRIEMYEMYERFLDLALMMKYTSKTMDVIE